ncbi:Class III chitinase [Golovinomyces cichoracearum]|uniref:chitinase n=1 Tax=Golovinomyces cichoracearum TaxID=62708 RepID=A0A420J3I4_9PEZI|nr:Class III chitinase [Golovinomyces cichoracearum]
MIMRLAIAYLYIGDRMLSIKQMGQMSNIDYHIIVILIIISFLTTLHDEVVNFASATDLCQPIPGTKLKYCPEIEEDITECQKTYGKTIILSIGGAAYNESGFSSEEDAINAAEQVWKNFGPLTQGSTSRPFGGAVVDGFDFDFEVHTTNMMPFADQLRSLMDQSTASGDKYYYLTAAPQCPFPDSQFGPLLDGTIRFDAIMVQFYNNFCGADTFSPGSATQQTFNFATWDNWAKSVSRNPDVKIMLGIPGGESGSKTGYVGGNSLISVIEYSASFSSFGGVMIWDMTELYDNTGFLDTVTAALNPIDEYYIVDAQPVSEEPKQVTYKPDLPSTGATPVSADKGAWIRLILAFLTLALM